MNRNLILIPFLAIAVVTLACGINLNLLETQVITGPTVVDEIDVPNLENTSLPAEITLSVGAGELKLTPGAADSLVTGEVTYNVKDFKPEVNVSGNQVQIKQGDLNVEGIPKFEDVVNEWDLKLGNAPMELSVRAGAYKGVYELGGLTLSQLDISDGASDVDLSFSQPNKTELETFRYTTGASQVNLSGLANANADTIVFRSGAGDYTLDFSGTLVRDLTVDIESAISSITVIVPEGVSARVSFSGGFTNVDIKGGCEKDGSVYVQSGSGPEIRITITMGAGSLKLRN